MCPQRLSTAGSARCAQGSGHLLVENEEADDAVDDGALLTPALEVAPPVVPDDRPPRD